MTMKLYLLAYNYDFSKLQEVCVKCAELNYDLDDGIATIRLRLAPGEDIGKVISSVFVRAATEKRPRKRRLTVRESAKFAAAILESSAQKRKSRRVASKRTGRRA